MNVAVNQIKYGSIKRANFITNYWNHGYKKIDSTPNEGKSVVAEIFIKTSKDKIYKYITSVSNNVYIDKVDDIVKKRNNKYHRAIKINPGEIKSETYNIFNKENTYNDLKFKAGNYVRILICSKFAQRTFC